MGQKGDSEVKEFLIVKLEWHAWGTDIVTVDVYVDKEVDADELEKNEGELERKLGEGCLMQSIRTGLITTRYQPVNLV